MREYQKPEMVLYNACLASGDIDNPVLLTADALAINQGQISALGSSIDLLRLAGIATEKIDLGGRLVVPGFIDSHIHFYEWALARRELQLDDLSSLEELLARVATAAQNLAPGRWITGRGWNETEWNSPQQPTRQVLDKVAPEHPVVLWRCDLHLAVANSAALRLAGIDRATPDPAAGRIERDGAGEPSGILRELAVNLVRDVIAPPELEVVADALTDGIGALHQMGITGIQDTRLMADADGARSFRGLQTLERNGLLDLRCWMSFPGHRLDEIIDLGLCSGFGSNRLRVGHVKFFADGGMGARTAWMIDPYVDAECGMPLMEMVQLAKEIDRAERAGLAVMVHAVGDRANRELVSIFEKLQEKNNSPSPRLSFRHRIEHVQMIRLEDLRRLSRLDLALCVTPANMILDMKMIDSAVAEKGKWTYPFRRLLDTGLPVVFSSDCPVCSPDPLPAIHAAVTRQRFDGTPEDGWYPESRIRVAEALNAYTKTPAEVYNCADLGGIGPGKRADLAVLSQNILTSVPSAIAGTKVDMTLFNGRVVHRLF